MTPVRSAAPTPSDTPSKAPVLQENIKPETATAGSSKTVEPSNPAVESAPSSIALALRQAGQEAAQKAKDGKKKAPVETFDGVGEAEPVKKDLEKSATIPPPIAILDPSTEKRTVETKTKALLQSPTSTAWRKGAPDGNISTAQRRSIEILESMQSPNSTAWKPTDVDPPILTHRGSSISLASAEEIRQIEEECKIDEVDEEDEEEDDDEEEEEDDEEDDEEDEEEDGDEKAVKD